MICLRRFFLVFLPFSLYSSTWTHGAGNNNWSDPLNWSGGVPNGTDAIAMFPTIGVAQTVDVDLSITVGQIHFDSTDSYLINGSESLIFSHSNTIIADNTGVYEIAANIALQPSALKISNNTLNPLTISGDISGNDTVITNIGLTILSGSNSYSGSGTNIDSGSTIQINTSSSIPATTLTADGTFILNTGIGNTSLQILQGSGTIDLNNNILQINAGSFSGTIMETTGPGGIKKTTSSTLILSGINSYSGTTTVTDGTLEAGADNTFSPNSAITTADAASATVDLNGYNQTIPNISGGGTSGGNVLLGSATLTQTGTYGTFSGSIQETGGLTLSGSGTFQLNGTNNTYSGTTTINSGTLLAGAANAFSSFSAISLANTAGANLSLGTFSQMIPSLSGGGANGGNVLLGSATLTQTGTYGTYSGSIQDAGNLTLSGSGTFQLNGANNTYSGTTTVNSGTLRAGTDNAFSPNSAIITANAGSATVALNGKDQTIASISGGGTNGGNVTFGSLIFRNTLTLNGTYGTYSGAIQGRGNLTLNGTGTFQLLGSNTYNGTTTINAGTLQAGADNTFSSSSGMVVNGGVLDLNGHPNTISSLSGSGDVTLGANTGILTISGNNATTYSGQMSGSGGLTQQGTGTSTLTGTNIYNGPTVVNGGTLVVGVNSTGSLSASNVTVNSGGTLKGTGTISQAVTVGSGGTISGGNSIGTINLGSLTLSSGSPGSNLILEINNAGQSTVYDVSGSVDLAGNLAVMVDRGVYQAGTTYTFITSSSSGVNTATHFDSFTSDAPGTKGFSGSLDIQPAFVRLTLTTPIYAIIPTTGLSGNAKALADYLNRFQADPAVQSVLLAVGALPPAEAQAALNSISPARNAISSWTAQNTLFGINTVAINRMMQERYMRWLETQSSTTAALTSEPSLIASRKLVSKNSAPYGKTQTAARKKSCYAVWAEGLGLFAHQNAINENPAFHSSTGAGLIGADFYGFSKGQVGAAIGYAQSSVQESGQGSGSIQSYLAGVYETIYLQRAYVELGLWGAFDQFHNQRNVVYPGFSATAKSNHNGWQLIPHIGGGYDVHFSWGTIEPFASFDAAVLFQDGYSEHGAGVLDMHVRSSTSWLLRTEAGFNAYQVKHCAPGDIFFRETLSYVNLAPFSAGSLSGASLVGYPPGFTVTSFTNVQNMISPGFEIFFQSACSGLFFSMAYDGEFTIGPGRYLSHEGIGKIGWFF